MKLWTLVTLCTASLLILSGCALKPTPKKDAVIDESLPMVKLTKNGTIVDANAIALEWERIEDPRVKGIFIYKINLDDPKEKQNEYYDTVENRFSTHYLDTNIKPSSKYGYYFKTYSETAESRKSDITTMTSLPPMESVSWIHSIESMPRSAKIIWRPHINQKVKGYVIQRKTLQEDSWRDIATVNGRLNAEFIDKDLKDNFTYKYRIRALTFDNLLSNPSQEVKVVTKELPKEITQITASMDLPRRIEIKWEKSDAPDFLVYRVYRSSNINGSYSMVIDTKNNSYVDLIEEDGKEYFYRVSVFDKDKLESIHSNHSALGKTLIKPNTPSMVEAKLIKGKVVLSWSNSDARVKSYNVQKRYKKSLVESSIEDFEKIKGSQFVDSEIEAGKTYYYRVFSVDANGIKSEPSIEIELNVEEAAIVNSINNAEKIPQQKSESVTEPKEDVIVPLQDFN
ncbi:MAG: hypothetical protein RQ763_05290 [Sulfurimonas sp.]|uniref:hypothetical protein n=1 Tax=Sulfurimonas sp. TaxID=2022749 RepID=UPI0028CEFECE|nr:hypothetical protein [Sulfurimonas sp.]MDT8338594.1 hypothetical protein [Sulfurimonas sp.]